MLFNFRLRPVTEIAPWTPHPHLHWFGLTLGWYWLDVGGIELFRSTDVLLEHWRHTYPQAVEQPYDEYQVARVWEDVLEILPAVLEPVPLSIERELGVDGPAWATRVQRWSEDWPDENGGYAALFEQATSWWFARRLPTGYLRWHPQIWFWRVGEDLWVRWDARYRTSEGLPVWTATTGAHNMPLSHFVEEVRSFDQRLMDAMAERIKAIQIHWPHPTVTIDMDGLEREQRLRSMWLSETLHEAANRDSTDWDQVLVAVKHLHR